jgi:hypothetical protein
MAHEFEEVAFDGHNCPTWALDVKISGAFREILPTLSPLAELKVHVGHVWVLEY